MRAAPPVSVQCSGGLPWRVVQAALAALAAGVLAWWALMLPERAVVAPPLAAWMAALAAAVAGVAGWRTGRQPCVRLTWDGQRWSADGTAGALDVMIDLGNWLLLRLRPASPASAHRSAGRALWTAGGARWIAVSARDAGPALHALRTAVHAYPPAAHDAVGAVGVTAAERTAD